MRNRFKKLKRLAECGPGNFRNEYLIALTFDHNNPRAAEATDFHNRFAELFVNGDLPAWFYHIFSAITPVALIKEPVPLDALEG